MNDLILAAVLALVVILVAALFWLRAQQQNQLKELQEELAQIKREQQRLTDGIEETRAGGLGVGNRVKSLAAEFNSLANKLKQLEEMDPDSKVYTQAIQLVKQGASVDDVMQQSELPRAEVQMLFDLHAGGNEES